VVVVLLLKLALSIALLRQFFWAGDLGFAKVFFLYYQALRTFCRLKCLNETIFFFVSHCLKCIFCLQFERNLLIVANSVI
jgi:hypothetical protein